LSVLTLAACNDAGPAKEADAISTVQPVNTDSSDVISLVRNMYQWYESKCIKGDFMPAEGSEDRYKGIDWETHAKKVSDIKRSQLFSGQFIENYSSIAFMIDSSLKTGGKEWLKGDLSPFSDGADAWCACQDSPERYWLMMDIQILNIKHGEALLTWTLPDKEKYTVKASKENDGWKISALQGFDYAEYSAR
jgi:hypothetical protein